MTFVPVVPKEQLKSGPFTGKPDATEYLQFYCSLGEALAQWSVLEFHLCGILLRTMGNDHGDPIIEIYETAASARAKISIVDAALRTTKRFKIDMVVWADLHEKLLKATNERNEIAHRAVYYDVTKSTGRRLFLGTQKPSAMLKSRKHHAELRQVQENFRELCERCYRFLLDLTRQGEPPEPIAPRNEEG
jgi:hypothetical protein